jgi:hypothetical protein
MMPPQLTEAWSIAYLQILTTLIIFALGIPAFVYQIMAPENIRTIIAKHLKSKLLKINVIVLFITVFALCFVWYLHPCSDSIEPLKEFAGTVIITIALIVTLIIWWRFSGKFLRQSVVDSIEKKLNKRIIEEDFGLIEEMNDLITLGERSEAGYEKEIVLKAISRLIKKIQDLVDYSGSNLEYILRDLKKIVGSKDKPGNESDFQLSIDILAAILQRLSIIKPLHQGDEILIYQVLKEIGNKSVELKFSKVLLEIFNIVPSNSSTFFEIGKTAFKAGYYYEAQKALSKLESLALESTPIEPQAADDLSGLLAYFWKADGSAKRYAKTFFDMYGNQFSSLEQCLDQAVESHYMEARYETADKLITMKNELLEEQGKKFKGKGKGQESRS